MEYFAWGSSTYHCSFWNRRIHTSEWHEMWLHDLVVQSHLWYFPPSFLLCKVQKQKWAQVIQPLQSSSRIPRLRLKRRYPNQYLFTLFDELWPLFHFWCHRLWPKLTSSMYTAFAGGNNLFNDTQIIVIGSISLKCAQKCSKIWVKNAEQKLLPLHVAVSVNTAFSEVFEGKGKKRLKKWNLA